MKVKIIKGTNQIGGCIAEISTRNTRILIDFGNNLTDEIEDDFELEGLTYGKPKYDAVFITHSHGDHIGRVHLILEDIPIYVESKSLEVHNLTCDFCGKEKITRKINVFELPDYVRHSYCIYDNGEIRVTPYLVDHSSYNSVMFLIEGDGKKVLHTGDYRSNGYKGKIFSVMLQKIGKVDLLITEGTTLSRTHEKNKTEQELMEEAISIFQKYNQVLLLQSSTNIDRIVSFYKASKVTKKTFIEDIFTCNVVSTLKSKSIPNPKTFFDVYVWIPLKYELKSEAFKEQYIMPFEKYKSRRMFHQKKYAMMVKTSMIEDLKQLYQKKYINQACFIYSMWDGYKEDEQVKTFLDELSKMGIDIIDLHTSGHADQMTLQLLASIVKADKVIPIHTTNKEAMVKMIPNVILIEDNEEIEV